MYPHSKATFSRSATSIDYLPSPTAATVPLLFPSLPSMHSVSPSQNHLIPDRLAVTEFDSLLNLEMSRNNSWSSGCSSYGWPSSLATYRTQRPSLMQRSVSSLSLQKNDYRHPVSALFAEFLDSDVGPVRRVCSTGDLQRIKGMEERNQGTESALARESSMIIEGMSRACRYSPEEKKVRIERYRRKRNLRNFTKKIKYACRKTLADSRPRIRGRFARNEETDKNPTGPRSHENGVGVEEEDNEEENWVNLFDNLVAANLVQEPQDSSSFGLMF
ncbi:two-component response regulator-like APRR5 [Prosopis cineraria]|uniref:two-component response regulator-like APRR5 n=1 Tax=Prosopis cineraria TaxID=364024 RepID=UPI0024106FA7|nr:two-component response regulator-like APRR5 [Prosopis cineraria]